MTSFNFASQLNSELAFNQVAIPDLWQQNAVTSLRAGKDVVVHAPTGAGKTLIFELWSNLGKLKKGQAIYTVPTRALANDKLAEWRSKGWNVGIATGDLAENLDAPILVATLETQKNRLIRGDGPTLLVVDEYQMLGDQDRGLNYELALALAPSKTQLLLLSGSVANPADIITWFEKLGRIPSLVEYHHRPVPLEELAPMHLPYEVPRELRGYWSRFVAKALAEGLGPILLFAPRRRAAEKLAMELASQLPTPNPLHLTEEQRHIVGDSMAKMLGHRIAYHHSGLSYSARAGVIEPLAKAGQLRIVVATMGLAAGINFSLRSVSLVSDSYRRDYQEFPIKPDEILQMFGRAGRRGIDEIGYVLIGSNSARLRDAHPARLSRSGMVDWNALLNIMHAASERGEDPYAEAVRVQGRLFTSKPIFLGVENAMENPDVPCQLRTDAERARYVRKKNRQILNSQGDWEDDPPAMEVPLERVSAPIYLDKHGDPIRWWNLKEVPRQCEGWTVGELQPALALRPVIDKVGRGHACVIDDTGTWTLYGKAVPLADRLHNGNIILSKWSRRLTGWKGRQISDDAWVQKVQVLVRDRLKQQGIDVVRFIDSQRRIIAHLNYGRQSIRVPVDRHGQALWGAAVRKVTPSACQGCSLNRHCLTLSAKTGTAMLWRRLQLIDSKGIPTLRGRIVSFFSQGDGLAVAAALEDRDYPLQELLYDMANLHAGHRFSQDEHRWGGRIAMICHDVYGFQNIPGYLENGIPTQYGFGAESIVMDVHANGLNRYKWITHYLGAGDIDRIIIEWRSLLRQTVHSPSLAWDRWEAFQALARKTLDETESPTLKELPSLAYDQTQRVEHSIRLR
ncbi:MAG: DEAD/DEAH box helicase [Verrucomicrobiota bacterium]|nr:DEAD/DEAH box helicase [Verrucomicrobiota bacterium]